MGSDMWLWGMNVQRFLGTIPGWGLWVLMVVAFVAATFWTRWTIHITKWHVAGFTAGVGLVVLAFPDRTGFLGDFMLREGTIASSNSFAEAFPQALPLDSFLHADLPRFCSSLFGASTTLVSRLTGIVEAILFAVIAVLFASVTSRTPADQFSAASLLVFGGYLAMFTGLSKAASEQCLFLAAFVAFGLLALRSNSFLLPAGCALALSLLIHRSSLVLILPACYLYVVTYRRSRVEPLLIAAALTPVFALVAVFPRVSEILRSFDVPHHVVAPELGLLGPLRLLDIVNVGLVLSPLSLFIIPLLIRHCLERGDRETRFLILLCVAYLPLLLLAIPQQGYFRDWDVFAPMGVALSLLTAWLVATRPGGTGRHANVSVLVAVIAILSTLQWLIHFSDPVRGVARVRAYVSAQPRRSDRDLGKTWEYLGFKYSAMGLATHSADAFEAAAGFTPHRYLFIAWLLAELDTEDLVGGMRATEELTERFPEYPLGWYAYARVAAQSGDTLRAHQALDSLRSRLVTDAQRKDIREFAARYPNLWRRR